MDEFKINDKFEINDESKLRISLSDKAWITLTDDMDIFSESSFSGFINTIFKNFYQEAKSSVSIYREQRKLELDNLFASLKLDNDSKKIITDYLLKKELDEFSTTLDKYKKRTPNGRLYHINKNNKEILTEDCNEKGNFTSPGSYIKCVIEEYCSLPFIKRERIYRKEIYEKIEFACKERRILKIVAPLKGKDQTFIVYPYKILADIHDTQEYLTCYSRKIEDAEADKIPASFSMARLNKLSVLKKKFFLNAKEISDLDKKIANYSVAYLLGDIKEIHVRLTKKGKDSYQKRFYSRPPKDNKLSHDDVYVFFCSEHQIFNYFLPFGADAEIIKPLELRENFLKIHEKALNVYKSPKTE